MKRLLRLLVLMLAAPAWAAINVTVSGPAGSASQQLPDAGGAFDVNLPLSANAQNEITVTATDGRTNVISKTLKITQLSLQSIVVSQIRTEPLPVQRIEELVNEGVIKIDDPANYNVSQFAIVLTIGGQPVPIDVPIVTPKVEQMGYENIRIPNDPGRGGGNSNPKPQDVEVIVFEKSISTPDSEPLKIPGVMVIEGRIKTLKEFYSVRLLLLNTSGIFTLSDVMAQLTFPDGGLSCTLPGDGIADFGNILPGNGGEPGQKEREFIVRGDEIGVRRVQVDFGGTVKGPGIDDPIPFNGAALSDVEVKGPPSFLVEVDHPDMVISNTPYELKVRITNTGQAPALYTTFDLAVGLDGLIRECNFQTNVNEVVCSNTPGPVTRKLGHILPGETASQSYTIVPLRSGPITSCLGISDQNINLQVNVGYIGCLTGHYPPSRGASNGIPDVAVVPDNNQLGVSVNAPVTAFFSENMQTNTITTGTNGSFNVFDSSGRLLPGQLRTQALFDRTIAVWQRNEPPYLLDDNTEYSVRLTPDIKDQDGNPLYAEWVSKFRTTSSVNDNDPPQVNLSVLPPVNPNYVMPGQVIPIRVYAADAGSGIGLVELYVKDTTIGTGLFERVDSKTIFTPGDLPVTFSVDSANLAPGHDYLFKASVEDRRGNVQEATIAAVIATWAGPPLIVLPPDPTNDVLYGVSVPLAPVTLSGGVRRVNYYVDGATNAFATMFLPPYATSLGTFSLALNIHTVRADAVDALAQTGTDYFVFNLITNSSEPVVSFGSLVNGAQYFTNAMFAISGIVTDTVEITSVQFFLDAVGGPLLATNTQPFFVAASNLSVGSHEVILLASNKLGRANNPVAPPSRLQFDIVPVPPGPPPAPPSVTRLDEPQDGVTFVGGSSVGSAKIDVLNANRGLRITVDANLSGNYLASIAADGGDVLKLTATDPNNSGVPSAPTIVVVPTPPVVTNLVVSPATRLFTAENQVQQLSVLGQLAGGGTSNLTGRAAYLSTNSAVASVNSAGKVAALANGRADITATFGVVTGRCAVTVDITVITNIAVAPASVVLVYTGETASLTVVGQFSDGSVSPTLSGVQFANSDPSVISVGNTGLVAALADGNAQVYVSASNLPPVAVPVSVVTGNNPAPVVDLLNPPNNSTVQPGAPLSVMVRAQDPLAGVVRLYLVVTGVVSYADQRQISPAASDTTRSFDFTVPTNAMLGGTFVATVWAQDIAGLTSTPKTVTVNVADLTAPQATLLSPTNGAKFNSGQTVTVVVAASDNIGVSQAGYFTSGALNQSDSRSVTPAPATNVTFSFVVPQSPPQPELYIFGTARDTAGNTVTSSPVQIELTDADITAPETFVTAIAPPNGATALVNYTVWSGLSDLKYVQLYFRRDGIGTFNLYTETGGPTNILGRYWPQSGTNGTIVFDSTRMGGDGRYEFYTVGVDTHDNREIAPTNGFDGATNFNAGTAWISVTSSVFIAATNMSLDNANLRISNAVVTLEGNHTFLNVDLLGTGRITHAGATTSNEPMFNLTAWTIAVDSNAAVDVTGIGYLGGWRVDNAGNQGRTASNSPGSSVHSGGSYGGAGGFTDGTPNPPYGSIVTPIDLGSGGSSRGDAFVSGGNGGGRIALNVINVAADGAIRANGNNGSGGYSGSGSGGSVYIITRTLSGRGWVEANGGAYEVAGGGGRVAIHYLDMATKDSALIRAIGGDGSVADGGNGTVFFFDFSASNSTLVVDGQGVASPFTALPIPNEFTFDHIIIRNNARAIVDDPIVVNDSLQILTGSILTHSVAQTNGVRITAKRVFVDATSAIDVSGKGYRGGRRDGNSNDRGETLNGQPGAQVRAGGSYGGLGGVQDGPGGNLVYGTPYDPVYLGAGGSSRGDGFGAGGNGGGRITITATDRVTIRGVVTAEGLTGAGWYAGSGAGGSIKITTSLFEGSGTVSANGGGNEVGGGGGRILVNYNFVGAGTNDFNGLRSVTAAGGKGSSRHGSAGTVLFKQNSQTYGDLYVDATMTNATGSAWTPFTPVGLGRSVALTTNELTMDGQVPVAPGGLVGLKLKPNVNAAAEFTIVGNTDTTITVQVIGGTNLTDVASVGDVYAASYRFDNVTLRRGGWLVTSDKLNVNQTLSVTENGVITHFDATAAYEPGLDITANSIVITTNSAISVAGRGYLGGRQPGNGNDRGLTVSNALGSSVHSGGSYGGLGGATDGTPSPTYGDLKNPVMFGSGGSSRGDGFAAGGDGGGRVKLTASAITVDGAISANGNLGNMWNSGSGSGGSVLLNVGTLSGVGTVQANGGGYEVGGGGGRVAVYYTTLNLPASQIQALGGNGGTSKGGHGTIYLKNPMQLNGELVIDGGNQNSPDDSTVLPQGYFFDVITLRNQAKALADTPITADWLKIESNSRLSHTRGLSSGIVIDVAKLDVDATSAIDVSGKGYRGGRRDGNSNDRGETLNGQPGAQVRAGGSYGGLGGVQDGPGGNLVYGTPYDPVYLGAGGSSRGDGFGAGGNGGGRITITATDRVTIRGVVTAEGLTGAGWYAGSGAGGSIKITTSLFEGSGTVSANGGGNEVGGGGGRILVNYNFVGAGTNDFNGLRSVTAAGGKGSSRHGSAGTVLFKQNSQTYGDLYVDATMTNATGSAWTPFTPVGLGRSVALTTNELTMDGQVPVAPGGLVGLKLKPNVNAAAEFTIVGNTDTTITVQVIGGTNLTDVASVGDVYAASYRFDNVTLRRGGWLVTSDKLNVNQTLSVTENGVITHFDATAAYEPGLDITANSIVITTNSAISVAGRGYLGGRQPGNGNDRGLTVSNALGSSVHSGGSYGGLGGATDGTPSPTYGDLKNPVMFGSGGSSRGDGFAAGGDGGGRVKLTASAITVDGAISANGNLGNMWNSGSGSGGSVLLNVGTLSGVGTVQANGGGYEVGGGGGRVAVYYTTLNLPASQIQALGGNGGTSKGGHGTVFFMSNTQTNGDLVVNGRGVTAGSDSTPIPTNIVFDNVTFQDGAQIQLRSPLVVLGTLQVMSNAVITHALTNEDGLRIEAGSLMVAAGAAIDVTARGYRGGWRDGNNGNSGLTTNNTVGSSVRSGGSYGGHGGADGGVPNAVYGSVTNPVDLGSGGSSRSDSAYPGGNGGGRITLIVSGLLTNDGAIRADGQPGSGWNSGGGSGGSVKISAGALAGLGTIEADGGGNEVGGGGGRIAVYVGVLNYDTNLVTAAGGSGSKPGMKGTIYFGVPPAPPIVVPPQPLIVGFGFAVPSLPAPPEAAPSTVPVVKWAPADGVSSEVYVIEFSPSLMPWSGSTLAVGVSGTAWTSPLPLTATQGFFRVRVP